MSAKQRMEHTIHSRDNSFYVRFSDVDQDELIQYAFDMGYALEPEIMTTDPDHPIRFKIISKANIDLYRWVSKVVENIDGSWQDSFLYGFYRHGSFRNKYPIAFNVNSHQMRGILKRNAWKTRIRQPISEQSLELWTWNRKKTRLISSFPGCGVQNFSMFDGLWLTEYSTSASC